MALLYRKWTAASFAATLHAFLLGFMFPNPFGDVPVSGYLWSVIVITPVYMAYVVPAMFTYGILTSLLSDKAGGGVARKSGDPKMEIAVSGSLHLVFGLVLFWYSLPGAVLYFIIDRLLSRRFHSKITLAAAAASLLIPLLWFILLIVLISTGAD